MNDDCQTCEMGQPNTSTLLSQQNTAKKKIEYRNNPLGQFIQNGFAKFPLISLYPYSPAMRTQGIVSRQHILSCYNHITKQSLILIHSPPRLPSLTLDCKLSFLHKLQTHFIYYIFYVLSGDVKDSLTAWQKEELHGLDCQRNNATQLTFCTNHACLKDRSEQKKKK